MLPTILWVISLGEIFSPRWSSAGSPLQRPISSLCHFLRHLRQPCGLSPICHDRMFEGGPLKSKGLPCHLEIEYCSFLIMETSKHGLMGGSAERMG